MFGAYESADVPLHDLSAEEFALWTGFLQTRAALSRNLDTDLRAAHGLPLTDFEILLWLAKESCERMRMAALADTVLLSPSGLSRAIERLVARGLVRREPCPEDRRASYATLTGAGIALLHTAGATHAASIRRNFLAHLMAEERRLLASIWDRVLAARDRSESCGIAPCPEHSEIQSTRKDRKNS